MDRRILPSSGMMCWIEVRDDGKGFPDNTPQEEATKQGVLPRSLGLPTIRHQLSLFGGGIEIKSQPGAGTQVILIVPVAEASQGKPTSRFHSPRSDQRTVFSFASQILLGNSCDLFTEIMISLMDCVDSIEKVFTCPILKHITLSAHL